MRRPTVRGVIILAVLIAAFVYVYPTIGWMCLSDDQREARLAQWKAEDEAALSLEPSYWRENWLAAKRWSQFDRSKVINLGLDLQGGIHMVLGLDIDMARSELEERYPGWSDEEILYELQDMVLKRIRLRVDEFEAKEPVIQALGRSQIQVQLPGVKDPDRAKRLIMKMARLTFHIVAGNDETKVVFSKIDAAFSNNFVPYLQPPAFGSGSYRVLPQHLDRVKAIVGQAQVQGLIPEDKTIAFSQEPNPWDEQFYEIYLMDAEPVLTGEGLKLAFARPDQMNPPHWKIDFLNDALTAPKFAEMTEKNLYRNMAIVVDGIVVSAPTIQSKIGAAGMITGAFSMEQARDLSIALNSGSLPVPIREDFTGVVGATLGEESVRKGVLSSIIGLVIVVIFMMVYYRFAGLVADVALFLNAFLVLAALAYFGATLTLPGIAGLILTIGMAVDANVLIFERIREELRNGRSLKASIESGYARATVTILDANVTTLIAAAVLMEFGSGPIEGFAVTLSIGVCASVFTALVVSRAMFDWLHKREVIATLTMMSLVRPDTKIRFLDRRRVAFILSTVVIAGGMVVCAYRGSDNLGVDFRTGTNMVVRLETPVPISEEQVRASLREAGFDAPEVKTYDQEGGSGSNRFLVRLSEVAAVATTGDEVDITVSGRAQTALATLVGSEAVNAVELEQVDTVGPAVGRQLQVDAFRAILYALIFIVAYLWFRFEFRFALAAVVALVHDVLVTVGLFALTEREISLAVVAALLTIIGYSLNDTIVVFDRIREDLRLYRGRGLSYAEIMDLSINQTLSRTLLTSLTTLFVVAVLFIFGGAVIHDFAFALIVGVVVGTYSSIFVASPVAHFLQSYRGPQAPVTSAGKGGSKGSKRNAKAKAKEATA